MLVLPMSETMTRVAEGLVILHHEQEDVVVPLPESAQEARNVAIEQFDLPATANLVFHTEICGSKVKKARISDVAWSRIGPALSVIYVQVLPAENLAPDLLTARIIKPKLLRSEVDDSDIETVVSSSRTQRQSDYEADQSDNDTVADSQDKPSNRATKLDRTPRADRSASSGSSSIEASQIPPIATIPRKRFVPQGVKPPPALVPVSPAPAELPATQTEGKITLKIECPQVDEQRRFKVKQTLLVSKLVQRACEGLNIPLQEQNLTAHILTREGKDLLEVDPEETVGSAQLTEASELVLRVIEK